MFCVPEVLLGLHMVFLFAGIVLKRYIIAISEGILDELNKELSGMMSWCYLSNKLTFGKHFINNNFNVYSLYFFFLVIQFYSCTFNTNLY